MIKSLIITIIILMILGVLSLQKPDIVGVDFYWAKYKWFYIPKYKRATNKYYKHQIKVIGIGLIMSMRYHNKSYMFSSSKEFR